MTESPDRREPDAADPDRGDDFASIATDCPSCGSTMRPVDLGSGAVVLRCPVCGQTAI